MSQSLIRNVNASAYGVRLKVREGNCSHGRLLCHRHVPSTEAKVVLIEGRALKTITISAPSHSARSSSPALVGAEPDVMEISLHRGQWQYRNTEWRGVNYENTLWPEQPWTTANESLLQNGENAARPAQHTLKRNQ